MAGMTESRPAPAACLTVLALLNPLNSPSIPIPPEGLEDLSRLPPSLRPLVRKVFQLYRRKRGGRGIAVGEFKAMYERITATGSLVVRAVEPANCHNPAKAVRLSGEISPTRSLVTTAASFASPQVPRLSLHSVTASVRENRPKRPVKSLLSYTQQFHRRRNSETSQNRRDFETAQSMVRTLNQSLESLGRQSRPSLEGSRREALLLVRKRYLEQSRPLR